MSGGAHKSDLLAHDWLKAHGYDIFQADWIATDGGGRYFVVEAKEQDRFVAPPFDGHGLPPWQVDARLKFQKVTGIPSLLLVFDKKTEDVFVQWLDVLDRGPSFDTSGDYPRRVYPLESFEREVNPCRASTGGGGKR